MRAWFAREAAGVAGWPLVHSRAKPYTSAKAWRSSRAKLPRNPRIFEQGN